MNEQEVKELYKKAEEALDHDDFEQSISGFTKFIQFVDTFAPAYSNRGNAYVMTGQYDNAIEDYTKAIQLDNTYEGYFIGRAAAYMQKELYDEVITDSTQAIQINPLNDSGFAFRAYAYFILQMDDKCLADTQQAIQINPEFTLPYRTLGLLFHRKGDYHQSLSYFDQAAQLGDELAAEHGANLREKLFDAPAQAPQEQLPLPSGEEMATLSSQNDTHNLKVADQQRRLASYLIQTIIQFNKNSQLTEQQHQEKLQAAKSELDAAQQKANSILRQVQDIRHRLKEYLEGTGKTGLLNHNFIQDNKDTGAISQQDVENHISASSDNLKELESKKKDSSGQGCVVGVLWVVISVSLIISGVAETFMDFFLEHMGDTEPVGYFVVFVFFGSTLLVASTLVFLPSFIITKNKNDERDAQVTSILKNLTIAEHWANQQEDSVAETYQHRLSAIDSNHEKQQKELKYKFRQQMGTWHSNTNTFIEQTSRFSLAWDDPEWDEWQPRSSASSILRIGSFTPPFPENFCVPLYLDFPGDRALLFKMSGAIKETAIEAVQATILRLLATIPPGRVKFTFVDPVGLGQNVAPFMRLADHDDSLVNSKAWTEPRHIEQRLANLTEHMETVIQKYLQNKYATIEDYNAQAEVAEPYQVLVVLDFPVNFSEEAARRLVSIAQNGSRCGVFTIVLVDLDKPRPYGFKLEELERTSTVVMRNQQDDSFIIDDEDYRGIDLLLEKMPNTDLIDRILDTVGQASTDASKVEVPFDRLVPASDQWWSKNASSSLVVPIGPTGARKHQEFEVGKGTAHHALVVGKTGSGKSTLLHILITSIALNYSPEEVELYLIDFKKGVEFKTYATHRLPHARVIAIESEREFGLSVLEGLYQEYEKRGDRFRNVGVNGLKAYREATGQPMTRILLLVDEFHKFFIEQDKIATRAYQLLELLVREGRSAGIHVLLASQTLTGSASLPNSIKEQIGIRVALQCSEADSRLILSDDNPAARLLSRPGEAIYNEANGLVEGNNTFQVAWLTDEQREHYLHGIQNRAQADQTTQIVFEGNQPADIEKNNELQTALTAPAPTKSPRSLKAWVGEPTAIREPTAVTFQRESGNNLLMVGTDEQAAMGMLVTSIISLAAQLPHTPAQGAQTFSVLDFSTTDTEEDNPFQYLAEKLPHPIAVGRRRQLSGMINVVANEVQRRLQDDDTSAPPIFLIIYGLQRARDLRLDAPGTGYGASTFTTEEAPSQEAQELGMSSSFASEFSTAGSTSAPASASNPSQQLPMILREGPDFGVYTMVWCDTMTNLNRTFERSALREFILRVAFQMSENDSHNFVDSSAANKLGDHRALLYNDEKGTGEKFRPYAVPSQQWVEESIKNLTG